MDLLGYSQTFTTRHRYP